LPLCFQGFLVRQSRVADLGLQMLKVCLRLMQRAFGAFTGGAFHSQGVFRHRETVGGHGGPARDIARAIKHNNRHFPIPHKTPCPTIRVVSLKSGGAAARIGRRFVVMAMIRKTKGAAHQLNFVFCSAWRQF
jgi:hypothetical protein